MSSVEPTIALLSWGNVLEDFLDPIGVSLETFCQEFRGSWIFGYVDAMKQVGVRTVIICMSARVATPTRCVHTPTGATICLLPAPKMYRALQRKMVYPYGQTVQQTFGDVRGVRRLLFALLQEVAIYLATPPRLLAQALRREECDAILCQEYEYPRFDLCVLLGKLLRLPVFAVFQGGNYQHSRLERLTRPLSMRYCTGLIIATGSEAQRVRTCYNIPDVKLQRIFNPIDLNVWRPVNRSEARAALNIPLDARIVVWHGRVALHKKGIDILLAAWERICGERTQADLRLLLVGTGDDVDELEQRLTTGRLQNVLWINTFVHDPIELRRYLSAADVYAFSSRYEGFPVAVIEAMACCLPVVATDADGVLDIFEGGESSGGLVVPRDDVQAFARALGCVLNDENWGRELGKRARRRVEACFSLSAIGEQLRSFLLNGRRN